MTIHRAVHPDAALSRVNEVARGKALQVRSVAVEPHSSPGGCWCEASEKGH